MNPWAFSSFAFLAASTIETALYLSGAKWYYLFGPTIRRDEFQTSVPSKVATATLVGATDDEKVICARRDDVLCVRRAGWKWGILPRLALRVIETPVGAVVQCEVRPFFGAATLGLSIICLFADAYHFVITLLAVGAFTWVGLATWVREFARFNRLNIFREQLRLIEVRVCEHCGYDRHRLDPRHPCPECGRPTSPPVPVLDISRIQPHLTRRASLRRSLAWLSMVGGLPITCFTLLPVAAAFWLAACRLTNQLLSFSTFWTWSSLVGVPLLLCTEYKSGGRYFEDSLFVLHRRFPEYAPLGYSINFETLGTARPIASIIAGIGTISNCFIEFLLQGPRLALTGIEQLIVLRKLRGVSTERASEVLQKLLRHQQSIELDELLTPGEDLSRLIPVLAWLAVHGWIGVSSRADRVFPFSETREILLSNEEAV